MQLVISNLPYENSIRIEGSSHNGDSLNLYKSTAYACSEILSVIVLYDHLYIISILHDYLRIKYKGNAMDIMTDLDKKNIICIREFHIDLDYSQK